MDSTQGASVDGLVVLDEWHVRALVAPDLSTREAAAVRDRVAADLGSWVVGLPERLGGAATVRIEIGQ